MNRKEIRRISGVFASALPPREAIGHLHHGFHGVPETRRIVQGFGDHLAISQRAPFVCAGHQSSVRQFNGSHDSGNTHVSIPHPCCYSANPRGADVSAALLPSPARSDCAFTRSSHALAFGGARSRHLRGFEDGASQTERFAPFNRGPVCSRYTARKRAGSASSFPFTCQGYSTKC